MRSPAAFVPEAPSALRELVLWLFEQLAAPGIGSSWRKSAAHTRRDVADVVIFPNAVAAGGMPNGSIDESVSGVARFKEAKGRKVTVQLGPGSAIVRTCADRRVPLSRALAMARMDLAVNTPFSADDVMILPLSDPNGGSGNYAIVKREIIGPWLEAAARRGQCLRDMLVSSRQGVFEIHSEIVRQINSAILRRPALVERLAWPIFLFFSFAAVANVCLETQLAISDVEAASAQVHTAIEGHRLVLAKRQKQVDAVKAVYGERKKYLPLHLVLETLTKAIPDGTYLTSLDLDGSRLRIAGLSSSSASLIGLLARSGTFESPRFSAPVVREADTGLDRFSIEVRVKGND